MRALHLYEVFDMDIVQLPGSDALPSLATVGIDGLRKTHAAVIRERWAGVPQLELRGARPPIAPE